jgi:hypothetical protein
VRALSPAIPQPEADRLRAIVGAARIGLAVAPLAPSALATNAMLEAAHTAPHVLLPFPAMAGALREILGRTPGDRVVLVGDAPLESDWCLAGRLAAYLPAERYFGRASG